MRLSSYLAVVSARGRLLALMNLVFFGCVFTVFLLSDLLFPLLISESPQPFPQTLSGNVFFMFLGIFLFNLVVSSFIVVTLPGFLFFPLSTGFLLFRGFIWGVLLHYQPTWVLLVAMPTLVLEGEAYALAAVAGTVTGFSWFKPERLYGEEGLGRTTAFTRALRESVAIYFFVCVLLLLAAIMETTTLLFIVH
jgi:hypothetical protein